MTRRPPPNIPDLFKKLCETAEPFIDLYHQRGPRLNAIVKDLGKINDQVKEENSKTTRKSLIDGVGGALLGVGMGAATVGALVFGEGEKMEKLSFGLGAILLSNALTYAGFKTVYDANSEMLVKIREIMEPVNELCEEFQDIIELQKNTLNEVRNVLDEINERSAAIKMTAGDQAETTLSEIDSFLQLLHQMDESADHDRADLLTQLVSQCGKTYEELTKMRDELKDFEQ